MSVFGQADKILVFSSAALLPDGLSAFCRTEANDGSLSLTVQRDPVSTSCDTSSQSTKGFCDRGNSEILIEEVQRVPDGQDDARSRAAPGECRFP